MSDLSASDRASEKWSAQADRLKDATNLNRSGGGGTFDGMERLARLEAQMESVDKRLDKIDDKLDRIIEKTAALPTTNGLWGMVATVIGVGLAIAGLTFAIAEWVSTP